MSETKVVRVYATNDGIPHLQNSLRFINKQSDNINKVIRVTLEKNILSRSSASPTVPDLSKSDEDTDSFSLSKNAILARENRLKKKKYVKGLEENLSLTIEENKSLKRKISEKDKTISNLEKEILYLKSVLTNVKEISSLINTVKKGSQLPVSTSLGIPYKKRKVGELSESVNEDIQYELEQTDCDWLSELPSVNPSLDADSLSLLSNFDQNDLNLFQDFTLPFETQPMTAGVCLHVFNEKLSLEFCSLCASKAQENWTNEGLTHE